MKGSFLEGGIRVPFIFYWPKSLPSGKVFKHPFTSLDLLPTFVAAAGKTLPPRITKKGRKRTINYDGQNLLPFLRGEITKAPHEALFWRMTMRVLPSVKETGNFSSTFILPQLSTIWQKTSPNSAISTKKCRQKLQISGKN